MEWLDSRSRGLLALGFFLARRGLTAAVGLGLTVLCVLGFGGLSVVLARSGKHDALADVPLLASSAIAFSVGVLVAFAAATRAFRRDEDDGIRGLLCLRGVGATGYLAARVTGLAITLAGFVGGGSALVGVVTLACARDKAAIFHTLQASLAAVVFGLAFAMTFAPVAMATLGARSRGRGYVALLVVLVLPDVLHGSLAPLVSPEWLSVCSIPGALVALRTAIAPVGVDLAMLGRSVVALLVVIVGSLLVVRAEVARTHATRPRAERAGHLP